MAIVAQSEPLKEFLVWQAGPLQTTYYDNVLITPELLLNTFLNYQKLGRRISLDKGHNVSDTSLPIEQRISIGTFVLELRSPNELWAADIKYATPEFEYKASTGQFGIYISQEFAGLDILGNPVRDLKLANSFDLERVTLTDDPATINARPIIKLSKNFRDYRKTPIIKLQDNMDKTIIEHLQQLMAVLPTVVNALGAMQGMPANTTPAQDTDNDAVQGVDIDGDADDAKAQEKKAEKVEPEDRKLDAAPAASAMPSNPNSTSVEDKKEKKMQKMQKTQKLEKKMEEEAPPAEGEMPEKKECHYEDESAPEEKKMDAGDTDVHEGTPEGPQVSLEEGEEDKKILEYIKYKFGKSLDEVQGKLFALEGEADKTVKLQKQLKDQKKLSKEQITEANLQVAIKEGKISLEAKERVQEFKKLSIGAQKVFLQKSVSIFDKVIQPSVDETVKIALQKTNPNSRVVDCMPFQNRKK